MNKKLVREYYSQRAAKEWRRLARKNPYYQLEFNTSLHFLKKYLPKKGLILDAGGGPGRYSIALAKLGYDVVLLDLTPELLQLARKKFKQEKVEKRIKGIVEGSIDDLPEFKNNSFDAVICLGGTLSHILAQKAREKAISELARVAKKNAPIFISVIGRLAVLVNELVLFPQEIAVNKVLASVRDTGDYLGGYGFTACHFFLPEELETSFKKRKIRILEMVGLQGVSSWHRKETDRLFKKYPKAWKIWIETHYKTCTHPAVVGLSEHFMIIGKK
ncbi:MAG: class I SAM-dependent methyltransferase [Parcubacteria group bacterium]|nr:class I SAM-dependent methyltransferase [Parcubacteria group bacterium]